MTQIALQTPLPISVPLTDTEKDDILEFLNASKSDNTRRAYSKAWQAFVDWCASTGRASLPSTPEAIMAYLTSLAKAGRKVSTIEQALAAITFIHQQNRNGYNPGRDQLVRNLMAGIRRKVGMRPEKKKAFTIEQLTQIINELPRDLRGQMAKAIILVGVASALRRSNLAGLNVTDVSFTSHGMTIFVGRSKTDQEGKGAEKYVPRLHTDLCPVTALEEWLAAAGINKGPIFRKVGRNDKVEDREHLHPASVAKIVKLAAEMAGLDPEPFAGHTLRATLPTLASMAGTEEWKIQKQTGHKSERVLRGYMRADERAQADVVKAALGQ